MLMINTYANGPLSLEIVPVVGKTEMWLDLVIRLCKQNATESFSMISIHF